MTRPDHTAELMAAMAEHGLEPGTIKWDGKLHRFPGAGKKKGNDAGWYRAFADGRGAVFGDYSQGIDGDHAINWQANNGQKPDDLDPEEWARMKREWAEAAEEREIQQVMEQDAAAEECTARWRRAKKELDPDHQYLVAKGIDPDLVEGVRQEKDLLLIPMKVPGSKKLSSLQEIAKDGKKKFAPGGRVKGARTTIGAVAFKADKTTPLYIAEGWATAWAIHQATGHTVVVAFSDRNLKDVAVYHRERFPDADIIICADNDRWTTTYRSGKKVPNPGFVAAFEAAKAAKAKMCAPDFASLDGKPTDFHDLWQREGPEAVLKWLDPARLKEVGTHPREEEKLPEQKREPAPAPPEDDDDDDHTSWYETAPFRCLGYDRDGYYYLPRDKGQFVKLSARAHQQSDLLQLAPLTWWEDAFPGRTGANWTMAADALIRASHRAGVWSAGRMRGRGCWPDEKGYIVHLGDRLSPPGEHRYVDPETFKCSDNLVYERLPALVGPSGERTLDLEETQSVLDLFLDLLWHEETAGYLLAGWTALAPLCGALVWRPHVWVVGGVGSGKTTVLRDLVVPLLGDMSYHFEGGTSEAGIRQRVGADALPVVYDEAERDDQRAAAGLQRILQLARSASSTGSEIVKGTTHGSAMSFIPRSMFCLASIGGAVRQEADKSRVSLLQLRSPSELEADERAQHWARYGPKLGRLKEQPHTGRRLIARTLAWLRDGRLKETLTTFRGAATTVLGNARAGDQYGTLYSGAWTMMADTPPAEDEAREIVRESGLNMFVSALVPEGMRALQVILQRFERIDSKNGVQNVTVGRLVDAASGNVGTITEGEADLELRQRGLRVDVRDGRTCLLVANKSEWLNRTLADTPYADNIRVALRTLPGVEPGGQVRFAAGINEKTTVVPLSVLDAALD